MLDVSREESIEALRSHLIQREFMLQRLTAENEVMRSTLSRRHPDLVADVQAFHAGCLGEDPLTPTLPSDEDRDLRWDLIDEEVNFELKIAMEEGDLVGIADAIADSVYVLIGTALRYGIPFHKVWNEVQRSNMTKFVNGKAVYRDDGKVLKGEGFSPADIAGVLQLELTK